MLENLLDVIRANNLVTDLTKGRFGIEVEEHRLLQDGKLSRHVHPTAFGSRTFHPYLQSDFSETQTELITGPADSSDDALRKLAVLQDILRKNLQPDELIWPLSMPPRLTAADYQWLDDTFARTWYQEYRDYLKGKYGLDREIMTGVHINFSLNETFLTKLYDSYYHADFTSFVAFKNTAYFKIVQRFAMYRWLFTYLFGAAPFSENASMPIPSEFQAEPVRSFRASKFGFNNADDEDITASYASLTDHLAALDQAVTDHTFFSADEFYGPVRLKGQATSADYLTDGIHYLEFRIFDTDPFDINGISSTTLDFFHLFAMFALAMDNPAPTAEELSASRELNHMVALENPTDPSMIAEGASHLLQILDSFIDALGLDNRYRVAVRMAKSRVEDPTTTPAARLARQEINGSIFSWGMQQARDFNDAWHEDDKYTLPTLAFLPDTEQQVIKAAVEKGLMTSLNDDDSLEVADKHYATTTNWADLLNNFPAAHSIKF
ncbi:hypothetical protein EQG49_07390 [Periweissella cryptocerci]|uniref:Glutamate--cysteine ligase n=1 Tax=Periweissella cryptocerci TaxID=2506420 RepID=A0A4P6YU53_9LACO|nr:hypothetical protein [Periweissella cryptocerci]QBO36298.1 hypothetical protein EQG49_07390 [Periweissella cryptocerci]